MANWYLLAIPSTLIILMFYAVMKSKIKKKLGRQLCRTFTGIFVIAYAMNDKILLMTVLTLGLIFLLAIPKKSLFARRLKERDESGVLTGMILYLLMVMLTIVVFPLWIAGCCLVNLSFADGFASIIGEKGRFKMPWNNKKTFEGSLTFLLFSFVGCYSVLWFLSPLASSKVFSFSLIVSLVASLVESLSLGLDDNIRVPLVSGIVLYLLTMFF